MVFVAGCVRCAEHDLKLLLAHGTVSQLGFLMVLFGMPHAGGDGRRVRDAARHDVFKAALFMLGRHRRPEPRNPLDRPADPPLTAPA